MFGFIFNLKKELNNDIIFKKFLDIMFKTLGIYNVKIKIHLNLDLIKNLIDNMKIRPSSE